MVSMLKVDMVDDNSQMQANTRVHDNFRLIYSFQADAYIDACKLIEAYGPDIADRIVGKMIEEQSFAKSKEEIQSLLSGEVKDADIANSLGLTIEEFNKCVQLGKDFNDRNRYMNISFDMDGMQEKFEAKCPTSTIIPKEVLTGLAKILPQVENGDNNIYLCQAGRVTCIGTTLKYFKNNYEEALGKDLTKTLQVAENLVDNCKALYYSKDGKTWVAAPKGKKGKALSPLQSRIKKDGETVYLSSQPGGKGDVIKLSRIAGAGFNLEEVNGQKIRDITNEEALTINVAALELSYTNVMKKMPKSNWNSLDVIEQAWLTYLEFHNPRRNTTAIKQSGLGRATSKAPACAVDSIKDGLKKCPNKGAINVYKDMKGR